MKNTTTATALGEVVDLIMGQAPSSKDCNFDRKGIPFVKVGEFGEIRPVIREWTTNPLRMARRTDVLVCVVGATCGKINLGAECAIGRSVAAIRPHPAKLDQFYLYYFMMTLVERLRSGSVGAAQTVISKDMVESIQIPFPPLPEQQRIVGILDEAFDGIATAKANAEKNLQNARALFESHLQSVFTQRGKGWAVKPLSSLCSLFVDSAHRTPKYRAEGIPALRPRDVVNGKLTLTEAARVSEEEYEIQSRRHRPAPGDIVYSRELSYGWAVVLPEAYRICLSQGMCLFRPIPNLDSTFLLYVLNSPVGREQALRAAVGAAHPHINLGDIKAYQIPFPSLSDQKRISRQLDAMVAETERLESVYRRKLAALEALKKSLLHQAFTGKL